ncbi:hypothetical protein C0993_006185 [Termitomyces sp. T159_Od127]|nr:hypothetical protein C0993_006185 [Termitomyces sp. T159_Od127]
MDRNQQTRQAQFSNYLNLLSVANYEDPASRWSTADDRDRFVNPILRVLDTIALCMATGESGDVIASTFYKTPEKKTILLSKNADPSSKDRKDGDVLIKIMQDPDSRGMLDILPFIAYRGAKGVQKRLKKLSELMETYRDELLEYIRAYTINTPGRDGLFKSEFPQMGEAFFRPYKDNGETSSTVKTILRDIIATCVARENFVNDRSSFRKFTFVVSAATALGNSKFFENYIKSRSIVKTGDKKYSKLWRNLDKVRQYIRINDAIYHMKQEGPFTVKWVTKADLSKAAIFEVRGILLSDMWDTINSIRKKNTESNMEKDFNHKHAKSHLKNMNSFFDEKSMKPRSANTTLHAELRLIVYLETRDQHKSTLNPNVKVQHPIGCSKRSCLACTWTMEEINKLTRVTYLTAGSHTGVYATSALIGPIDKIDPEGTCGKHVFQRVLDVSKGVVEKLSGPLDSAGVKRHGHKHSEDYASASDPDGEGEPDKSSRSYDFAPNLYEEQRFQDK